MVSLWCLSSSRWWCLCIALHLALAEYRPDILQILNILHHNDITYLINSPLITKKCGTWALDKSYVPWCWKSRSFTHGISDNCRLGTRGMYGKQNDCEGIRCSHSCYYYEVLLRRRWWFEILWALLSDLTAGSWMTADGGQACSCHSFQDTVVLRWGCRHFVIG